MGTRYKRAPARENICHAERSEASHEHSNSTLNTLKTGEYQYPILLVMRSAVEASMCVLKVIPQQT